MPAKIIRRHASDIARMAASRCALLRSKNIPFPSQSRVGAHFRGSGFSRDNIRA